MIDKGKRIKFARNRLIFRRLAGIRDFMVTTNTNLKHTSERAGFAMATAWAASFIVSSVNVGSDTGEAIL
jgi:hypothetical protein